LKWNEKYFEDVGCPDCGARAGSPCRDLRVINSLAGCWRDDIPEIKSVHYERDEVSKLFWLFRRKRELETYSAIEHMVYDPVIPEQQK
jgi:hypothetical protein